MRLRYYPSMTHLINMLRSVGGNQCGIIPGTFYTGSESPGEPYIPMMTTTMPAYHKILLDPMSDVQYHLGGYGLKHEEAMIKLIGESIERYAGLISVSLFKDRLRFASYRDMCRSDLRCLPLDYLAIFEPEQRFALNHVAPYFSIEAPAPNDVIAWIRCASLVYPGQDVWIPAQLFFMGFRSDPGKGDKMFAPSVSTGTAAHLNHRDALRNALIEAIQIDAVMINWYTNTPGSRVLIDDGSLKSYLDHIGLGPDSPYDVWPVQVSRPELPLPNFVVFLVRKDESVPYMSAGVQADADPRYAIMRSCQESISVLSMSGYAAVHTGVEFFSVNAAAPFMDLDSNVYFFSNPHDGYMKKKIIESRIGGEVNFSDIAPLTDNVDHTLETLISELAAVSEWAAYLDITPTELQESRWCVMRVFIPELCSLCLPGMPPRQHPRLLEYGGVVHDRPHPFP